MLHKAIVFSLIEFPYGIMLGNKEIAIIRNHYDHGKYYEKYYGDILGFLSSS
jgi:hypothetical protein